MPPTLFPGSEFERGLLLQRVLAVPVRAIVLKYGTFADVLMLMKLVGELMTVWKMNVHRPSFNLETQTLLQLN